VAGAAITPTVTRASAMLRQSLLIARPSIPRARRKSTRAIRTKTP
jgi:hypothetical protein